MAKFETRQFGSKKQLLIIPNRREVAAIKRTIGLTEYRQIQGEVGVQNVVKFKAHVKYDDYWQPYLVLERSNEREGKS